MELQKLKYFHTIASLQHVTKAAEQLHVAQPALSQAMRALEEELGVKLLAKEGRRIVLTPYGEHLKSRLDSILPELDGLPAELEELKSKVSKTVRLNILAASTFVINAIVGFQRLHPDVVFDFEQNESKKNCDIVVTTNETGNPIKRGYRARCIKEESIYLAVPQSSRYAEKSSISLEEVKDEKFVMFSNSRLFGVICNKFCSIAGFTPKVLFESDSPNAVQNMISTGVGVAFWPAYSWGRVKNKNVVLLPISKPLCQRELIIELSDRATHSVYAEQFYEYLLKKI
ncbi:MAG: LysR family transcriptional regulator [Ruminococcaceae bacterium]|nr:LysR family transcriptional regulator [Oscillospiraceae bacterium]